ncbi:hypothetical protein J2Y69_002552 [Microbacterium resistens]|uniref:Glycine rich protein n=1 Tax=Microbacterium resistens TaxID=156977 RepID=A0ABU1SEC0_9MICO|nr:hypothetical protein [Microbacterium resistens]MDR6867944.1 hypothetical protein [Microbacterium resistens]
MGEIEITESTDGMGAVDGVQRRAVVKGAAWSIPVIAMAVASPMASASTTPVCRTVRVDAPLPTGTGRVEPASRTTTFTVPATVTRIDFAVAGGAGGGGGGTGGSGALVTGVLSVVPGEVLTLTVGQGGWTDTRPSGTITRPEVAGGQGYGDGGTVVEVARLNDNGVLSSTDQGGSGGGGSAILSAGTPLVVAGGGGGRSSAVWEVQDWNLTTSPAGGNGGQPNSAVANRIDRVGNDAWLSGGRGLGGSGSTPGAGGTGSSNIAAANIASGANGAGRDGGNGQLIGIGGGDDLVSGAGFVRTAAGAGGGGYAGGGAGGRASFSNDVTKAVMGGPAGGGSNYGSPRAVGVSHGLAGNNAGAGDVRRPGWITLSYEICS